MTYFFQILIYLDYINTFIYFLYKQFYCWLAMGKQYKEQK